MHPSAEIDGIIVGLHLRWRGVWQRPNHIISRLARSVPVVVLQEPGLAADAAVDRDGGVTILTPGLRTGSGDGLDAATLASLHALTAGMKRPLVWLNTPMMFGLAEAFADAPLVYDKMDELAAFAAADPRLPAFEDAVLEKAAVVFAGGRSLHAGVRERTERARLFPSGVDAEHFARKPSAAFDDLTPAYAGRTIFGYVGVIDERLDLELIAQLADAYPEAVVAMIGPVAKIDQESLPQRANIAYYGPARYDDLPELLARLNVALMPFALSRHTANISPTKTLEYLAAGLPVVSTAVPDVVADHAGNVTIATDRAAFVAAVGAATPLTGERLASARAAVARGSWDGIVAGMRTELAAAGIVIP